MILTRVIAGLIMVVLLRLIDHAWRDFSAGAAEMVMTAAILGAMIIGVVAIDLLSIPSNVQKK